jgi:hypothetical protein
MTQDQLAAVLKASGAKPGQDGYHVLPEGATLTLHLATGGARLDVAKIEALKIDGDSVQAKTAKKELFFVSAKDIFSAAIDTSEKQSRRAGFG